MPLLQTTEEPSWVPAPLLRHPVGEIFKRFALLDQLQELYERARVSMEGSFLENLLSELRVSYSVTAEDLNRVPATGPVLAVSNHPFGMLEGVILGALLERLRSDVKIMTNCLLAGVPELRPHCIFVDPYQLDGSSSLNYRALRNAAGHLRKGGMLVVFPAGEVAHWSPRRGEISDPRWSANIAGLIGVTGAAALPVYVKGANTAGFQLLGLIHPWLRTASLPRELLNKAGRVVEIRIGKLIPSRTVAAIHEDRDAAHYLRWRTHLLARREEEGLRLVPRIWKPPAVKPPKPVAEETDKQILIEEIRRLQPEQCLDRTPEFSVFVAEANQIPGVLREIGRLREIGFRAAGEGAGNALDLDDFDSYYLHLFLWNQATQELVGAYRMVGTQKVLSALGVAGLYTSTLFHFDRRFFEGIGPALELGRSFVRPEYQRQPAPLMMLWKGIGRYVGANSGTPVLFGAVSVSNVYCRASRELLVQFLRACPQNTKLAGLIRPRRPFRISPLAHADLQAVGMYCAEIEEVSAPISDIEPDGKGLPVLLRQYSRLGGTLLGFNLDDSFCDALDCLMLVDLRKTSSTVLARYMGAAASKAFLEVHSGPASAA